MKRNKAKCSCRKSIAVSIRHILNDYIDRTHSSGCYCARHRVEVFVCRCRGLPNVFRALLGGTLLALDRAEVSWLGFLD